MEGRFQGKSDPYLEIDALKGLSDEQAAEAVLQHFGRQLTEHSNMGPPTVKVPIIRWIVNEQKLVKIIKNAKLTKGTHSSDLSQVVIKALPDLFAKLFTPQINVIIEQQYVPAAWRSEEVTLIPKIPVPTLLKNQQNISITP